MLRYRVTVTKKRLSLRQASREAAKHWSRDLTNVNRIYAAECHKSSEYNERLRVKHSLQAAKSSASEISSEYPNSCKRVSISFRYNLIPNTVVTFRKSNLPAIISRTTGDNQSRCREIASWTMHKWDRLWSYLHPYVICISYLLKIRERDRFAKSDNTSRTFVKILVHQILA